MLKKQEVDNVKCIAELNKNGFYSMRIVKETLACTPYIHNCRIVFDYLFILEDGTEFVYKETDSNQLFENLESCKEYIEYANSKLGGK